MDELIREFAKLIGVDPALIGGSLLTLLAGAVLYLARTILSMIHADEKQASFGEQLVRLSASAIEESRKQRETYERNITVMEGVSVILKELVKSAYDLKDSVPKQFKEYEASVLTMFSNKTDEMHKVTERRDSENVMDRAIRDANQKELREKLETIQQQIDAIKTELSDTTDPNTLRSILDRLLAQVTELANTLKTEE